MLAVFAPLSVTLTLPAVRVPAPGDAVAVPDYALAADGPGVLAARAAARQDFAAAALGPVGDDGFGQEIATALAADGVGTRGIRTQTGKRTACRVVCRGDDGGILAVDAAAASGRAAGADLPPEALRGQAGLVTHSGLPAAAVAAALARAGEAGVPAVVQAGADATRPPADTASGALVVAGWATAHSWAARAGLGPLPAPACIQALAARWAAPLAVTGAALGTVAADGRQLLIQPDLAAHGPAGEAVLAASLAARLAQGHGLAAALPGAAAAASRVAEDRPTALPDAEAVAAQRDAAAALRAF